MEEEKELEEEKTGFHSTETAFDKAIRRMEEKDAWIDQLEDLPASQMAAAAVDAFNQNHIAIADTIESLKAAIEPYHDFFSANSGGVAVASSIANMTHAVMADNPVESMSGALSTMVDAMKPYRDVEFLNSNFLAALESATKTPQLLNLQEQLENSVLARKSGLSAVLDYLNDFESQWNSALGMTNIAERSIAAQNFAIVRILPEYGKLDLPRGSKSVLKSLTKVTAKKLTQTEDIRFDPKERKFYHKDFSEQKLTADQITVVESSQEIFADISLDELISFESQLYEDVTFAMDHPVGKRIFEIIKGWNKFINFDADTYYHARKIENGQAPFLDQEMMKAPANISSHGRYNAIGKSCYYIAETKEGALSEISKHSGGKKIDIQVAGLKPIKSAKIIDLSEEIKGTNRFMEHLRFTVENEEGKIIKNYLLPNFVASCCKKIGIDGIKYKSAGYNCCVLWKDDYFEFVEGSRDIIRKTVDIP